MQIKSMLEVVLDLFDGGADAAGAATSTGAAAAGETTNGTGDPQQTGSAAAATSTSGDNSQNAAAPAAEEPIKGQQQKTPAQLRDEYRRFVESDEFKPIHTEHMQQVVNRRFAETKQLEDRIKSTQPLLDLLAARYGVDDGDPARIMEQLNADDEYWEVLAARLGMSKQQAKQHLQLTLERNNAVRENALYRQQQERAISAAQADRQYDAWLAEADEVKKIYPNFDLETASQNERFVRQLTHHVPMLDAYRSVFFDQLVAAASTEAANAREEQVVNNVRARGVRPNENGATGRSGFTSKVDVSKLTKAEREDIARRARMGERIEL